MVTSHQVILKVVSPTPPLSPFYSQGAGLLPCVGHIPDMTAHTGTYVPRVKGLGSARNWSYSVNIEPPLRPLSFRVPGYYVASAPIQFIGSNSDTTIAAHTPHYGYIAPSYTLNVNPPPPLDSGCRTPSLRRHHPGHDGPHKDVHPLKKLYNYGFPCIRPIMVASRQVILKVVSPPPLSPLFIFRVTASSPASATSRT